MQEVFLEELLGGRSFQVLKTYDCNFAREVLEGMDGDALTFLSKSLDLEDKFELPEIPAANDPEYLEFMWAEVLDNAREDGSLLSFFVVTETQARAALYLYVSPDWPSAKAFVKSHSLIREHPQREQNG